MNTPDPSYRTIPLTRGQVALVDEDDYERISVYKWYAYWNPRLLRFYAARNIKTSKGGRTEWMHRVILGLLFGDPRIVDHRERLLTLDNRKSNLRIVTEAQNRMNSKIWGTNKCGFKGVFWNKQHKKYQAGIVVDGKYKYLGRRNTPQEAFELVKIAVSKYHGEFGRIDESCIVANS